MVDIFKLKLILKTQNNKKQKNTYEYKQNDKDYTTRRFGERV
jgi:hypothetical protein